MNDMPLCRITSKTQTEPVLVPLGPNRAMRIILGIEQQEPRFRVPELHWNGNVAKQMLLSATFLLFAGCVHHPTNVSVPVPPKLPEAPTGLENPPKTNGFELQADMDLDLVQFVQLSTPPTLGPHFNGQGCVSCHFNPGPGGSSAAFEHRIGPDEPGDNVASATLIHTASMPGFDQQRAPVDATNALRASLSLFGDGFVEQVPDALLEDIARQNGGEYVLVPVLESPGATVVGRFGAKDQEGTLLSFAGDANFNEVGICNRLVPSVRNGDDCYQNSIEDSETPPASTPSKVEDIDFYASFMRSLKAPPAGTTTQSLRGKAVFARIGCQFCHLPTLYTRPYKTLAGPTVQYQFHPYGDYLLHDIGTGDGIMQGFASANKVRTSPLWGVSHKDRFLHDGSVFNFHDAIEAHKNEANFARHKFNHLRRKDRQAVIAFLATL